MSSFLKYYHRHRKALVAALSAVVVTVSAATSDNQITNAEWRAIGLSVVTAVLVYLVRNETE